MRNLPAGVAGAALHPPVVAARALPDLQEHPNHGGIGRGGELTLRHVTAGLRIERVEPNTTVDGLLDECELRVRILILAGNRVVQISWTSYPCRGRHTGRMNRNE